MENENTGDRTMTRAMELAMPYLISARSAAVDLKIWEDREMMARTWKLAGRPGADVLLAEAGAGVREAAKKVGTFLGLAYRYGHCAR